MDETDQMVAALDPFAAAALRQKQAAKPAEGRQAGPATHVLANYLPHVGQSLLDTLKAPGDVYKQGLPGMGLSDEGVEAAVPKAVGLATLGPGLSAPTALAGGVTDPMLAALYLRKMQGRPYHSPNTASYHLLDDTGSKVGTLGTTYDPKIKDVYVEGIYSDANKPAHSLGLKDIRSLMMALRGEHPDASTVSGLRVSGARQQADAVDRLVGSVDHPDANAQMKLPQFKPEQLVEYQSKAPTPESRAKAEYREATRRAREDLQHQQRAAAGDIDFAAREWPAPRPRDPAYVQQEEFMQALRSMPTRAQQQAARAQYRQEVNRWAMGDRSAPPPEIPAGLNANDL